MEGKGRRHARADAEGRCAFTIVLELRQAGFDFELRVGWGGCKHGSVKRLWALVYGGFLLVSSCGGGGDDRAVVDTGAVQAGADASQERGCVWVGEAAEGAGRLYLCGTIHQLRATDYPLPEPYEAAYAQTDEVILELPPGSSGSPELPTRMQELGTLPKGERLERLVTPEEWERVASWAKKRSISLPVLNGMRPWFASLVMVATEYQALGAVPEQGVDQFFEDRAKQDGKPGRGLETIEQQLALFSRMPAEQQQEVLKQTLAELETVEEEYDRMIAAWRSGDLEGLMTMLFREASRYPDLMETFLHARNRAWMAPLEETLKEGRRAMVLVGAGHLGGKEGLLALLKRRGYAVRRL